MDHDGDIRVLPFTDEEKARLNEKIRKMRFARPPPKLPSARRSKIEPSLSTTSRYSFGIVEEKHLCDRKVSVDDSGISSCDSEKGTTPVYQRSPTESTFDQIREFPCSEYVCDGCDWVPEDLDAVTESSSIHSDDGASHSPVQCSCTSTFVENCGVDGRDNNSEEMLIVIKQEQDCHLIELKRMDDEFALQHCEPVQCRDAVLENTCQLDADLSRTLTAHPVEFIDTTSPVVYSKRLERALGKDRGGLLEIPQRVDGMFGRFEEPKYGRLLLTTSVPVASLKEIMESTLTSLTSFLTTGKITHNDSEEPIVQDDVRSVLEEKEAICMEMQEASTSPEFPSHKRHRRKRRRRGRLHRVRCRSVPKNSTPANGPKSAEPISGRGGERRKRTMSVVSTTSDSSKKSIKMVFRREIPVGVSRATSAELEENVISLESSVERSETHMNDNDKRQLCAKLPKKIQLCSRRLKIAPVKAPSESCASILEGDPLEIMNRSSVKLTSDLITEESPIESVINYNAVDETKVFREDLRNPAVVVFPFGTATSFEENELIVTLCNLMSIGLIDTSDASWFHILQEKTSEYIRKLDAENNNTRRVLLDLVTFYSCLEQELSHIKRQIEEDSMVIPRESPVNATSARLRGFSRSSTMLGHESESKRTISFGHQHLRSFHSSHVNITAAEVLDPRASELDVIPWMPIAGHTSPCVSPPMRARKSLERIVERLKSPQEDVPRDPAPSTCNGRTETDPTFQSNILPAHAIECIPSGARGFWKSGIVVNKSDVRYERMYGVEPARNRVMADSHS